MTAASKAPAALSGGPLSILIALVVAIAAGCGASSVSVSQPAVPTPTATMPASTSSPASSPAAPADPGQAALRAFVALVTRDGFSYQATFTGESRHTVDLLPISKGLLQVSGQDVLVRATFTFKDSQRVTVEHRSVGGRGWIKVGAAAWQRLAGFGADQSMAAFAAVHGPADVTYLGAAPGGKAGFLVAVRAAVVNPVMIPASNLSEVVVTSSRLELVIDPAGRPVSGTDTIRGRGRVSGQLQEIVIDLGLAFTKVGQNVTIAAP